MRRIIISSLKICCLKSLKLKLSSSVSASVKRDPAVGKTLIKKQALKLHQEPFRKDSARERFVRMVLPFSR